MAFRLKEAFKLKEALSRRAAVLPDSKMAVLPDSKMAVLPDSKNGWSHKNSLEEVPTLGRASSL